MDKGGIVQSVTNTTIRATVDSYGGNSGSPLFDSDGFLVGILTAGPDFQKDGCNIIRDDYTVDTLLNFPCDHPCFGVAEEQEENEYYSFGVLEPVEYDYISQQDEIISYSTFDQFIPQLSDFNELYHENTYGIFSTLTSAYEYVSTLASSESSLILPYNSYETVENNDNNSPIGENSTVSLRSTFILVFFNLYFLL